jgi:predicted ATPase/class 3 adenylate cyclase
MMSVGLPSGTVTFLFTDIEGSTRLAQQYPMEWDALQDRHHAILTETIEANNGCVFQVIGDAFCAAFHTVAEALQTAWESQERLQVEPWQPAPIKVRMGIHTGAAQPVEDGGYRGYLALSSVQRIMSAGHGGQVLLSQTTQGLARGILPEGLTFRDLGEHHLKDFSQPERIYQLVIPGLAGDFPSLRTNYVRPNNLPVQLSRFIGREREVEQIKKRLMQYRLVTLTGSGGVGKTRLSIQAAQELLDGYPDGAWLVELAPLTDPSLVTQAICAVFDVDPPVNASALNTLTDYLSGKKLLLVMDNCEHLIDACAETAEALLHACPNLRILASSREALGIEGESAYRVPSLSLADPKGELQLIEQSEAVQLFVERARAALQEYHLTEANAPTIAHICQRLDGIALGIELAASRVKLLKVDQIAKRLDDSFRLLTGGSRTALPRQQTLRGTIDWSYNLLTNGERRTLRCLSAFTGGWTLEAAEYVCENEDTLDLLIHLVDKSLVSVDREQHREPRYYLLETIRQYAREKLAESGEGEEIRARHLAYFVKLAQTAQPELYGAGQVEWLQRLEDEHENIRAALDWSLQNDPASAHQLAAASWWSWSLRGDLSEGYEWLEKMLAVSPTAELAIRAELLCGAGWLAAMLSDGETAVALTEESLDLFRQIKDKNGMAFSLVTLATQAYWHSEYDHAMRFGEQGYVLYTETGNKWGIRHAIGVLGYIAEAQGHVEEARKRYEESLSLSRELEDIDGIAWSFYLMAKLAEAEGIRDEAMNLYEEGLQYAKKTMSKLEIAWIYEGMGRIAMGKGYYEQARTYLLEAVDLYGKMGQQVNLAYALRCLGWCAGLEGDFLKARSLYSESLQRTYRIQDMTGIAQGLLYVCQWKGEQGSLEEFVRFLGMAEGIAPNIRKWTDRFLDTEIQKVITTARTVLGDGAYQAAWEAGSRTSLEDALTYALKELQI